VNQGAVKTRGGIKLYALGVSVFVHAAALGVFATVRMTQTAAVPLQTTTKVSISQATVIAERPAVMPKPKVSPVNPVNQSRPSDGVKDRPIVRAKGEESPVNVRPIFDAPAQDYSRQEAELSKQPVAPEPVTAVKTEILPAQVEFFDSAAQGRRICYVVDCSGSMQGLWQRVKAELIDSIGQLQQDYYFCVIVFGAGSVLESGGGKMLRATEQAKKEAYGLIGAIQPRGTTDAATALERAIKIKDRTGIGPSLIYFLTDGFELSEQDNTRFAHQVATILRSFAPKTQINTIGFWCSEQDSLLLETIAKESGGQFTFIGREQQSNDRDRK
jgi:Mg-chelatase subunit ChlD